MFWAYTKIAGMAPFQVHRVRIVLESETQVSYNAAEFVGYGYDGVCVGSCVLARPVGDGECVLMRGDNEAAVQWIRRCRRGKGPCSGALMRLLAAIELACGWKFEA